MGRPRRKKGKTARRARQGVLGLANTSTNERKKSKQFEKRTAHRLAKKDEQQVEDLLRENIIGEKPREPPKGPHSFVIHTGSVGRYVRQLERDLRRVMSPHTSKALKVTKRNNFKDFVVNSQFLGVSHLLVLTRTPLSVNFRIIRNPQGPTLHFKVEKYSLAKDVLMTQKRPVIYEELFQHAPLVVMNGFGAEDKRHLQLVQTVVQNMFPPIDVDKVDVVVNSDFFHRRISESEFFLQLTLRIICEAVKVKYGIQLDPSKQVVLRNKKCQGELAVQRIRKRPAQSLAQQQDMPSESKPSASIVMKEGEEKAMDIDDIEGEGEEERKRPRNFKVQIVDGGQWMDIRIRVRDPRQEGQQQLVSQIERITLKMNDDRVVVLLDGSVVCADFFLPFRMLDEEAIITFDPVQCTLHIRCPIKWD